MCQSSGELALGQDVFYADEGFRVYRSLQNIFLLESDTGDYQLFETDPQRTGCPQCQHSCQPTGWSIHQLGI